MADDPITQTRLDVAEMKGMLSVALSTQEQRTGKLEAEQAILHSRITEQAQVTARHGEQIADLESRPVPPPPPQPARWPPILASLMSAAALVVVLAQLVDWR